MSEHLMTREFTMEPATINVDINDNPIKTQGAEQLDSQLLKAQGQQVLDCLVTVDYRAVRGTCIDERPRVGLQSQELRVEARPSVLGGPDIYALAIGELSGLFGDNLTTGKARLQEAKRLINLAGIKSGAHVNCAANAGLGVWLNTIATNPEAAKAYARQQKGTAYNEDAANEVIAHAQAAVSSGRYANWDETVLQDVLGEESDEATEMLANVPHEGQTVVRNGVEGTTINQTQLYDKSVLGKGSFDFDDPYADLIEHIMTSVPDAAWKKTVAEHAREMAIAAVAGAVPNPELYQLNLRQ